MKKQTVILTVLFTAAFIAAGFLLFVVNKDNASLSSRERGRGEVLGAIVPHHAPLTSLIDGTIQKVSQQKQPKTIILIGPNHEDAGIGPALTRLTPWPLPVGNIPMNTVMIDEFLQEGLVLVDEKAMALEHSMFTVLPVLHKYFPEATFVPIILSSKHDKNRSQRLGEKIGSLLGSDVLLVASIDFSHYLSSDVAPLKDEETLALIEKRDYDAIERLPTAYFDSGPSLMTFLRAVDFDGTAEGELVYHTNSGQFAGEHIESSTSYMAFIFRRSKMPKKPERLLQKAFQAF